LDIDSPKSLDTETITPDFSPNNKYILSTSRQEFCLTQHVNFIDNDEANLLEPLLHHQAVEERVRLLHRANVQRALVPPFLRREPAAVTAFNKGQPSPAKDRQTYLFRVKTTRLLKSACAFSIVHTYFERLCRRFCGGNLQQLHR
jgi:hypothetical protein